MPRTPRPALLLAVLAAALLGAGCTTAVPGTAGANGAATTAAAEPADARQDAVGWVDDVCDALLPFIEAAAMPQLDTTGDPATLVEGFGEYLDKAGSSADSAISGMADVGPSPVAGGDEIVTRLTETLTIFRTSFQDAKAKLDAVDTTDPQSLATELPAAIAPLQKLADLPDPTAGLQASAELDAASKQAPNCQQIELKTGG